MGLFSSPRKDIDYLVPFVRESYKIPFNVLYLHHSSIIPQFYIFAKVDGAGFEPAMTTFKVSRPAY